MRPTAVTPYLYCGDPACGELVDILQPVVVDFDDTAEVAKLREAQQMLTIIAESRDLSVSFDERPVDADYLGN